MAVLALILVALAGIYLIGLGLLSFLAPGLAARFLLGFVGSAIAHYLEMMIRFMIGGAFLVHSPHMAFATVFSAFGWILVVTTAVLFLIPWQWHRRFAQKSVPRAIRFLKLIAISSLALGCAIIAAMIRGPA